MPEGMIGTAEASAVARGGMRHGVPMRGGLFVPPMGEKFEAGRFGRMFTELRTPQRMDDDAVRALGEAMSEEVKGNTSGDNPEIAAGFTYLGQFVDHDITLDTTSIGERITDIRQVLNFRTPRLDLDSVYGLGPGASPQLYSRLRGLDAAGNKLPDGSAPFMLLGRTSPGGFDQKIKDGLPFDLPRSFEGRALIGDHRNDENLLVAQTHLAMLRFHNEVARRMPGADFAAVRQQVVWHYQWMVLRDFVGKLVDMNDLASAVRKRLFYRFETQSRFEEPFMPVEFSVAAYRLGHSMVRADYSHNRVFNNEGDAGPGTFDFFFGFSGLSGNIIGELVNPFVPGQPPPSTLKGGDPLPMAGLPMSPTLPSDWITDWRRFFDFGSDPKGVDGTARNRSRLIDPYLVKALHLLPGSDPNARELFRHPSLAVRNLARGLKMELPSGQDVARLMGVRMLSKAEIEGSGADGGVAKRHRLSESTPLWYYILKEAQVLQAGRRLGPVGSRIVAEVFVGLLQGDPDSFLSRHPGWTFEHPTWQPTLMGMGNGFAMTDLLRLAYGSPGVAGDEALSPIDVQANKT